MKEHNVQDEELTFSLHNIESAAVTALAELLNEACTMRQAARVQVCKAARMHARMQAREAARKETRKWQRQEAMLMDSWAFHSMCDRMRTCLKTQTHSPHRIVLALPPLGAGRLRHTACVCDTVVRLLSRFMWMIFRAPPSFGVPWVDGSLRASEAKS